MFLYFAANPAMQVNFFFLHLIHDLVEFYPKVPSKCPLIQTIQSVSSFISYYCQDNMQKSRYGIDWGLATNVDSRASVEIQNFTFLTRFFSDLNAL